jgi:hypothetical protein
VAAEALRGFALFMGSSSPCKAIPGEGRPDDAFEGPLAGIGAATVFLDPSRTLPALAVGRAWLRAAIPGECEVNASFVEPRSGEEKAYLQQGAASCVL